MQWLLLALMGLPVLSLIRRMRQRPDAAERPYRRAAWTLGLTVCAAMAVQEGVLLLSGMLTWQTGLPLHLCSMMGVLTLPMLVFRRRFLWHLSIYLGLPGAALALIFPAVLPTPWPVATELSFFVLHAGLVLAPLLPLGLGWRPSPRGAAEAGGFLLTAGLAVIAVNARLGSNYLFISHPVPGTPLELLARQGLTVYRLALAGLCAVCLAAEAAMARLLPGPAREKRL